MSQVALAFGREDQVVASDLQVSSLVPFTTAEWRGVRCAVVSAQGCPWRCSYCFEPDLQDALSPGAMSWETVSTHLTSRRSEIEAVVFSGGEPTRQLALIPAMREVKDLGLRVGLQTAGAFPGRLHEALPLVDWLALDIKAMPEGYADITTKPASGQKAWASLDLAIAWGGPLEVRLTVDPTTHTRESVLAVARRVKAMGGPAIVLQEASAAGCTPEYRAALAGRRIGDVLTASDLAQFEVRTAR